MELSKETFEHDPLVPQVSIVEKMRSLNRELPPLNIDVLCGAHETVQDALRLNLREFINTHDVYIPEGCEGNIDIMNMVSQGRVTPEEAIKNLQVKPGPRFKPFMLETLKVLYRSKTLVFGADVPEPQEMLKKTLYNICDLKDQTVSFEDFEESVVRAYKLFADAQLERENYIVSVIEKELPKVILRSSTLMQKSELKVGIQMGLFHLPIVRNMQNPGHPSLNKVNTVIFDHLAELVNCFRFGKSVSEDLKVRATFSYLCSNDSHFRTSLETITGGDTLDGMSLQRRLISYLTVEDIRDIFVKRNSANLFESVIMRCIARGMPAPNSKEDFKNFIFPGVQEKMHDKQSTINK